jgi:hypothetical protein
VPGRQTGNPIGASGALACSIITQGGHGGVPRALAGRQIAEYLRGACQQIPVTQQRRLSVMSMRWRPGREPGQMAQMRPITDEGVAVGGAFDSDTATGLMPIAHRVAGVRSFPCS